MKTEDLIAGLTRDAKLAGPSLRARLTIAIALSALVAMAMVMLAMGPRPDLASASGTMLFNLKLLLTATLGVAAVALLRASARPEAHLPKLVLVIPLALLIFGVGHEVATQAPANLGTRLVGRSSAFCLVAIPVMALAPLIAILTAMRASAPRNAVQAGAAAGFAASAIAAFFYAMHCADDSPLFVMTWYSIGILVTTATGAALGRRMLAW